MKSKARLLSVGLRGRECCFDSTACTGEVLLATVGKRLPALPESERGIEVQSALFEDSNDVDEFFAGRFVAHLRDFGWGVVTVRQCSVASIKYFDRRAEGERSDSGNYRGILSMRPERCSADSTVSNPNPKLRSGRGIGNRT